MAMVPVAMRTKKEGEDDHHSDDPMENSNAPRTVTKRRVSWTRFTKNDSRMCTKLVTVMEDNENDPDSAEAVPDIEGDGVAVQKGIEEELETVRSTLSREAVHAESSASDLEFLSSSHYELLHESVTSSIIDTADKAIVYVARSKAQEDISCKFENDIENDIEALGEDAVSFPGSNTTTQTHTAPLTHALTRVFECPQLILAELAMDAALPQIPVAASTQVETSSLVDFHNFAEAMSPTGARSDAVSDIIHRSVSASVNDEDLRPRLGLCYLSMQEADASIRVAGSRTAPYRIQTGAKRTNRKYICRSIPRETNTAAGTCQQDSRPCCQAYVRVQKCSVRQLLNGTFRRCMRTAPAHFLTPTHTRMSSALQVTYICTHAQPTCLRQMWWWIALT